MPMRKFYYIYISKYTLVQVDHKYYCNRIEKLGEYHNGLQLRCHLLLQIKYASRNKKRKTWLVSLLWWKDKKKNKLHETENKYKKDTIQTQGEAGHDSLYGVILLYPLINANI